MAQDKPTLCWKCERACGGCSWSADFVPVDGWEAIPTKIAADRGYYVEKEINSFIVTNCPLFKDDTAKYKPRPLPFDERKPIEKKLRKPRTIKGSLREKIFNLPDLNERIERLTGNGRIAAELVFKYNNTCEDVANYMYISIDYAKEVLRRAMQQMEAME